MKKHFVLLLFLALLSLFQILPAQNRPNVVFVLLDDLSWNGTSIRMDPAVPSSASDFYETPRLEQWADSGIIFSQAYCATLVCSPTRSAILTGKAPARTHFTNNDNSGSLTRPMLEPLTEDAIDPNEVTFPELIKAFDPDYLTANFGKWDISNGNDGPANHGFDHSFGNVATMQGNSPDADDPKRMFSIADSAVNFIARAKNSSRPFYLQLSHNAPHTDFQALPSTLAHWQANKTPGSMHADPLYGAMIADLDSSIGIVLDALFQQGYNTRNTYFIFMSDHGGLDAHSDNGILREGKASLYEGGIRVPMIVAGPGIQHGSRLHQMVSALDLYPTIIDWISDGQATLPADLDGGSMADLLAGNSATVDRANQLIFHFPHYGGIGSCIIRDSLKLHAAYKGFGGRFELYDIKNDIAESTDLIQIAAFSTQAEALKCELREYLLAAGARRPSMNPAHAMYSGLGGTPTDVDNDMLPDTWEFEQNLIAANDGNFDTDGDGDNDLLEYTNQTDPLCNLTTAIDKFLLTSQVTLFPNPTSGALSIGGIEKASLIQITNLLGQRVAEIPFEKTVDVSFLKAGLYVVRVFDQGNYLYQGRIVIGKN